MPLEKETTRLIAEMTRALDDRLVIARKISALEIKATSRAVIDGSRELLAETEW